MHQTIINLDSIKKELQLKIIKLPSIIFDTITSANIQLISFSKTKAQDIPL